MSLRIFGRVLSKVIQIPFPSIILSKFKIQQRFQSCQKRFSDSKKIGKSISISLTYVSIKKFFSYFLRVYNHLPINPRKHSLFRGVFRTQSNIYDGAFLRLQMFDWALNTSLLFKIYLFTVALQQTCSIIFLKKEFMTDIIQTTYCS